MTTLTIKDFVNEFCSRTVMDKNTVAVVAGSLEEWMASKPLLGKKVRLSFGSISAVDNKYKTDTLNEGKHGSKKHDFRPQFKFTQAYKSQFGNAGDTIREGLSNG